MNDEQQRLSRLITDVYDAALNPSFWVDVLRSAAGFVGGIRHLFAKTDTRRQADLVKLVAGFSSPLAR